MAEQRALGTTGWPPHDFVAYPEGHPATSSCVKCGRRPEHPYHRTEPAQQRVLGVDQHTNGHAPEEVET